MRNSDDSWKIFIRIKNDVIILRFIVSVVVRFWKKLITQLIIHFNILLFRRSWISRSCEIVSKTSITSRLNKMIIRFVFLFHTMWIWFVRSFKIDSIDLFLRHFMCESSKSWCDFVNHAIFLFMIDFMILFMMFRKIINRYVFEIV